MANFPNWSMDRNARQQLTARRPIPTIRPLVNDPKLRAPHYTGQAPPDDPSAPQAYLYRMGKPGIQVLYSGENPNAYRGILGSIYYSMLQFLSGSR